MRSAPLTLPEIGAIAGTRMALGAGIGLLCSHLLRDDQRRTLGWTLVGIGAASTIPLVADVFMKLEARRPARVAASTNGAQHRHPGRGHRSERT
jgi:hypothetical protein